MSTNWRIIHQGFEIEEHFTVEDYMSIGLIDGLLEEELKTEENFKKLLKAWVIRPHLTLQELNFSPNK